jgi:WD40 repeat protein
VDEIAAPQRAAVFISYAREDQAFVRRLYDALEQQQRQAWVDWDGIPPTADWMREVQAAIESADCFIAIVSAAYLQSVVCARELELAVAVRKRLVPVIWGEIDEERVPADLRRLNWIICRHEGELPVAAAALAQALDTDLDWVREHTRLLVRAAGWQERRHDTSLLLHGADLLAAEQWLSNGADKEPKPTQLHRDYILASRTQERRRARWTLAAVTTALVVAIGLAIAAWIQRQEAVEQRNEAERQRLEAVRENIAALTNESNASLTLGRELDALVASVRAGDALTKEPSLRAPSVATYRAILALRRAVFETHERNRFDTGQFRGVTQVVFSPDGSRLFTGGGGGDIRTWSLTGQPLGSFETEHHGLSDGCTSLANLAVTDDGSMVATLGNEGRFALWTTSGEQVGGFEVDPQGGFHCTGIVTSAIDVTRRLVTIDDGQSITTHTFAGEPVGQPAPSKGIDDFSQGIEPPVTAGNGEYEARVVREEGLAVTFHVELRRRDDSLALALRGQQRPAFSRDSTLLATVADGANDAIVHVWNVARLEPKPPEHARPPDDSSSRTVTLGQRAVALEPAAAIGTLYGASGPLGVISAAGDRAAVILDERMGNIELWRLQAGDSSEPARVALIESDQLASADHMTAVHSLAFTPDGTLLATGGSDGTVRIWDAQGRPVRRLTAHRGETRARFSPDGMLLVTWADYMDWGEMRVWSVDGESLDAMTLPGFPQVSFSPDGQWVMASGGQPSRTITWTADLPELMRAGCERLASFIQNPATKLDAAFCR